MKRPPWLRAFPAPSTLCFALSALSFASGWILVALAAPDVEAFFYQPRVLAITHTFTLGWISLALIGLLYQYVPVLAGRPLRGRRAPTVQVLLFALGANGMIVHFWIDHLDGMAWSAGLVLASVLLLAALLVPALLSAPRYDATVLGVLAGLAGLLGTATLGTLFAIDKVHPFLPGSLLSNLAGHAHLGLLGWVTLTICAVSYRMVAPRTLPGRRSQAPRWQVALLAVAVPALVTALLLHANAWTTGWALVVVTAIAWYVVALWGRLRPRRPPGWSLAHLLAAALHLTAASTCGLLLLVAVDPQSDLGNRLVLAYGVFALVGWIANLMIAALDRLPPELRSEEAPPLLPASARRPLFLLLNVGLLAVVAALVGASVLALRLAALLPLGATALLAVALRRRLTSAAIGPG